MPESGGPHLGTVPHEKELKYHHLPGDYEPESCYKV